MSGKMESIPRQDKEQKIKMDVAGEVYRDILKKSTLLSWEVQIIKLNREMQCPVKMQFKCLLLNDFC